MPGHNYLKSYLCSRCGDKPSKKEYPNLTRCLSCNEKLRNRPKTATRKRRIEFQNTVRY